MAPDRTTPAGVASRSDTMLSRVLGGMSVFTMLMTVPQVLTIWVGHQAAGVSVVSWSAYLFSAILWFWYGLQKRDKNIFAEEPIREEHAAARRGRVGGRSGQAGRKSGCPEIAG